MGVWDVFSSIDLILVYILVHIRHLCVPFELKFDVDIECAVDIAVDIDRRDRGGGNPPWPKTDQDRRPGSFRWSESDSPHLKYAVRHFQIKKGPQITSIKTNSRSNDRDQ